MGIFFSISTSFPPSSQHEKESSDSVDRLREKRKRGLRKKAKLLLLGTKKFSQKSHFKGTGESGKTTLANAIHFLENGNTKMQDVRYVNIIRSNAITCMKTLLEQHRLSKLPSLNGENESYAKQILDFVIDADFDSAFREEYGKMIDSLWKDPIIQKIYSARDEFYLLDSAK